jgi:hypothetical protein
MDRQKLKQLIRNPRESLDIELKQWIDPATPEGRAKIAIACIALRNNNGGCLIVGFLDSGEPAPAAPPDVRAMFHTDAIQYIIGKYASQPFPVTVEFVKRAGVEHPVIVVPSGVETPVAAKSELCNSDPTKPPLVKCDTVYVRTLNSNGTASSSAARWNDWPQIARHCFNSRKPPFGIKFLQPHPFYKVVPEQVVVPIAEIDRIEPVWLEVADNGERFRAYRRKNDQRNLVLEYDVYDKAGNKYRSEDLSPDGREIVEKLWSESQ